MSKDNSVFVRLPDEMLIEVDELVNEKRVKNRQAVIKEAIAVYLVEWRKRQLITPPVNSPIQSYQ